MYLLCGYMRKSANINWSSAGYCAFVKPNPYVKYQLF